MPSIHVMNTPVPNGQRTYCVEIEPHLSPYRRCREFIDAASFMDCALNCVKLISEQYPEYSDADIIFITETQPSVFMRTVKTEQENE